MNAYDVRDLDPRSLAIGDPPGLDIDGAEPAGFGPERSPDGVGLRRVPLLDQFPDCVQLDAWFSRVDVPDDFAAVSGQAAWFGLAEVRAGSDVPVEFSILNVSATLGATNPNATTSPHPWGDVYGEKAAIVVAINPPNVRYNTWTSAPAFLPTLAADRNSGASKRAISNYVAVAEFPPGDRGDTVQPKAYTRDTFAPSARRVRTGDRLVVALVVDSGQVEDAAGGYLLGYGRVSITAALTRSDPFNVK